MDAKSDEDTFTTTRNWIGEAGILAIIILIVVFFVLSFIGFVHSSKIMYNSDELKKNYAYLSGQDVSFMQMFHTLVILIVVYIVYLVITLIINKFGDVKNHYKKVGGEASKGIAQTRDTVLGRLVDKLLPGPI